MNINEFEWDSVARKKLSSNSLQYLYLPCIEEILKSFDLQNESRIADLGCYNGYDIIKLSTFVKGHFYGYDISSTAIEDGIKKINKNFLNERVTLINQDVQNLSSIPDKYFEVTLLKYLLQFIPNPEVFLQNVKRVTSKSVIIAIPVVEDIKSNELSAHSKRISMERKVLYNCISSVFGGKFNTMYKIKSREDKNMTIEVIELYV
ncbi:MAG: methyltransferase domain-containing protein [Candidatus Paceibacterota bacterium]|jgi:ubiquinone/menaquinone biosynthesis C-methylase UbiE